MLSAIRLRGFVGPAACLGRLFGAHLLASLTCGASLSLTAAARRLAIEVSENPRDWGDAILSIAPEAAGGVLLMTVAVSLVAVVITLPATILISPLACKVARRFETARPALLAGGLAGLLLGLPVTIFVMGLADWTQLRPAALLRTYFSALPNYGLAAVLTGVAFASVIVKGVRR